MVTVSIRPLFTKVLFQIDILAIKKIKKMHSLYNDLLLFSDIIYTFATVFFLIGMS